MNMSKLIKVKVWLYRAKHRTIALCFLLAFSLLANLYVFDVFPNRESHFRENHPTYYDCASQIKDLPEYMAEHVNAACAGWQDIGYVQYSDLSRFFRHNRIYYSSESNLHRPTPGYILFGLTSVQEDDSIEIWINPLFSQARRQQVMFHEMGHVVLWAARVRGGPSGMVHHDIMSYHGMCGRPGTCSD